MKRLPSSAVASTLSQDKPQSPAVRRRLIRKRSVDLGSAPAPGAAIRRPRRMPPALPTSPTGDSIQRPCRDAPYPVGRAALDLFHPIEAFLQDLPVFQAFNLFHCVRIDGG